MVWWAAGGAGEKYSCVNGLQPGTSLFSQGIHLNIHYIFVRVISYLSECPLGSTELIHHPKWDADHGRKREQPANDVTPPGVHIFVVVLQRSVFDEGEGKGTLKGHVLIVNNSFLLISASLCVLLLLDSLGATSLVCWYSQCMWPVWRTTNSTWCKDLGGSQSCPRCCHKSDPHLSKHSEDICLFVCVFRIAVQEPAASDLDKHWMKTSSEDHCETHFTIPNEWKLS